MCVAFVRVVGVAVVCVVVVVSVILRVLFMLIVVVVCLGVVWCRACGCGIRGVVVVMVEWL